MTGNEPVDAFRGATWEDFGDPTDPTRAAEPVTRVERRKGKRRTAWSRARRRRFVYGVFLTPVVLILAFSLWYELEAAALGPRGPVEVIEVHGGESVNAVVARLAQAKVIGSSLAFKFSEVLHGNLLVNPGIYAIRQNESFAEVRAAFKAGPNVTTLTVVPGLSLQEVDQRAGDQAGLNPTAFAKVAASGTVHSTFSPPGSDDLEGLLGTGTYLVLPGESDATLLRAMVQRFEDQAAAAGVTKAAATAQGLSPYQMITAASVVEKEGYIPSNMPDVARVIYNRLAAGMPLQMDSTVLYALGQDGGTVTPQDEEIQSPYNSYLNVGLPPTPICMSSHDALEAAAHPPQGPWIYFELVNKNGTEAFSITYAQQLANEALAQSRGLGSG